MKYLFIFSLSLLAIFLFTNCDSENEKEELTVKKWHTLTLSFQGPATAETNTINPFLNYLLIVEFKNGTDRKTVRGFYAADGNAAETSADSGSVWQVRFRPDALGQWSYKATLYKGDSVAISDDYSHTERVDLKTASGEFTVVETDKSGKDFRAKGPLEVHDGYFRYTDGKQYFLKAGTNSPENLLAYLDFDNTYRLKVENREGEAQTDETIHAYQPHVADWNIGDPVWQEDKGKGIIGAMNYLASKNMNAVYFLTLNIRGDGKDVWMYADPEDFTRFDVSKLEQWEIVFSHMQSKGILLHIVLQETENETLLDGGNLGPLRKLYFQELIARFAHHPALIWNLGEENGPAPWMEGEHAQNDEQRKAAARYLKEQDPYGHPVMIHTLPDEKSRVDILQDLLGFTYLDGISLQQANRREAADAVSKWKLASKESGHEWLISMDEIGMFHTGAKQDTADFNHPSLTRYVLWGTLLSGAAGVEWYFGARSYHNDLTSEDWRVRDNLWEITNHARLFFENHLPYWEMTPHHEKVNQTDGYCLAKTDSIYALYIPDYSETTLDLSEASGEFEVRWYNPFVGGQLQIGSIKKITGGINSELGNPPSRANEDWVILVRKI